MQPDVRGLPQVIADYVRSSPYWLDDRLAVHHQPRHQHLVRANLLRDEERAIGGRGHSDRVGDDHLVRGGDLAGLPVAGGGSGAVLRVGVDCDRAANVDHGDEQMMDEGTG